MKKFKYTDIFLIPAIIIVLISGSLYFNIKSINHIKSSLTQLPTVEYFTSRLSDPKNSLSKEELIGYSNHLLKLVKESYKNDIKSLNTTKNTLLFVLLMIIIWSVNGVYIYNKILKAQKALTNSSSGTTSP